MINIFQCYEEGSLVLPPPVGELFAAKVDDTGVLLKWRRDDKYNMTDHYEVHYRQVQDNDTARDVFKSDFKINARVDMVKISNLTTNKLYRFYVVSRNSRGTSLPSSLLTLNISLAAWSGHSLGSSSAPHQLEIISRTTSTLELSWNTPLITHPEDDIIYRVHYQPISNDTHDTITNTSLQTITSELNSVVVSGLEAGTLYQVWVTSLVTKLGGSWSTESEKSEVMLAWTKSYIPPFVQMRIVQVSL